MLRKMVLGLLIVITGATLIGILIYNKPHEDLARSKPDVVISADALFSAFASDEVQANSQYLGKIIEVTGTVVNVSIVDGTLTDVILASNDMLFGVNCEMDTSTAQINNEVKIGNKVTLICMCSGYTMDVVMNRCVKKSK
jgi:hypothetical protein